jgi:hypothetical protein
MILIIFILYLKLTKLQSTSCMVLHYDTKFLQPNVTAISPPALSLTTPIKTKELSDFFEQFTQTLAKAMGSQGNKSKLSGYTYDPESNLQMPTSCQLHLQFDRNCPNWASSWG